MKTSFPTIVLCAFLMVISSHATALAVASATPAPGNATTLKSFHESNDGTENYRTFEFEVSEPGDYHVRSILARSAKKIGDYEYDTEKEFGVWNEHYGYGLIDAYNAVTLTPRN